MKALGHLVSGAAIAGVINITAKNLTYLSYEPVRDVAVLIAEPRVQAQYMGAVDTSVLYALCFLGLLLPDCDSDESFISHIFHLPFEHRTWTHSIWAVLLFVASGFLYKPLWGLALGIFVHIFVDSFSVEGICWLYPLTRYTYKMKFGIKPEKYTTGLESVDPALLNRQDAVPPGWKPAHEFKRYKPKHTPGLYETDHKGSVALFCAVAWALTLIYYALSVSFLWK